MASGGVGRLGAKALSIPPSPVSYHQAASNADQDGAHRGVGYLDVHGIDLRLKLEYGQALGGANSRGETHDYRSGGRARDGHG